MLRSMAYISCRLVVKFGNIADFERNFDTYSLANLDSLRNPDMLILKISENVEKMTYPGRKSLYRYYDSEGNFFRDGILLENEDPDTCDCIYNPIILDKYTTVMGLTRENLHTKVYENQLITATLPSVQQCHEYLLTRAALLPAEHKRFIMPNIYKVGSSKALLDLREQVRKKNGRK